MSNSRNKRRWFQFHLSTAALMMAGMGGIIGANVVERRLVSSDGDLLLTGVGWPCVWKAYAYGKCRPWFTPQDEAAEAV